MARTEGPGLDSVNEAQFQGWITDTATRLGWRWWHCPSPMRFIGGGKPPVPDKRAAGLPDLILMHEDPARWVFAEVKGPGGRLSTEQEDFLNFASTLVAAMVVERHAVAELLQNAGVNHDYDMTPPVGVYLWRPGDESTIETILRSKRMI